MNSGQHNTPIASWRWMLLWAAWATCFALSLLFMSIFAQGILRDMRRWEPVVRIDISARSDWVSRQFRVWSSGTYKLFISSVNHDQRFVGEPLAGSFEVAVIGPDASERFRRTFAAGSTDHRLPNNYGDSQLAHLDLDGGPLRRWTLKARVLDPDPRFATAFTEIKLWKMRADPGMGGLINYVMIFPAGLFLLLAFVASILLARRDVRSALVVTVIGGAAFVAVVTLL